MKPLMYMYCYIQYRTISSFMVVTFLQYKYDMRSFRECGNDMPSSNHHLNKDGEITLDRKSMAILFPKLPSARYFTTK